jgi:8-oxo-dGTP pyrophosphatase MutT (NUDIX family)
MAHIHDLDGQHDHTTSAFIVYTGDTKPKLFLHMHKKFHKLLQAGGHIELNETPWEAITHELLEETGYDINQLEILQPYHRIKFLPSVTIHPIPILHNTHKVDAEGKHMHTDLGYGFVTDQLPRGLPVEGESTDIRWLDLEEISNLKSDEIGFDTKHIAEWLITEGILSWEKVATKTFL